MVTSDGGQWWLACNSCGDAHDLAASNRAEAEEEAAQAGWRKTGVNGSAAHTCPSCQKWK